MNQLNRCYHSCRSTVSQPNFWIGLTLGWPLEHFLYEHVWPFTWIARLLGIMTNG